MTDLKMDKEELEKLGFNSDEVPPQYDDPEGLIRHIADMANCNACYPFGLRRKGMSVCSRHRDPVMLANGWVHGWTMRGGVPLNYRKDDG